MVQRDPLAPRGDPVEEPGATLPSSAIVYGGRYAMEAELGSGGMGRVVRARDLKLGRAVALKLLAPGAHDEEQRSRFEREARAAGALNHPNIVAVYDVGEHKGEPYIVTELLEGRTLRQAISAGLEPEEALDLAAQLAQGLAAAHAKGIVHRDVKPENLFLTGEGRLKILDFGIAKLVEPRGREVHTRTGAVMGTPGYMSPEQVRGQPADARSDVFAFGAVLHEMLCGRTPFQREASAETDYAILHEAPPALPAAAPAAAARVVARCLQKDPAARYADAGELLRELGRTRPGPRFPRAARLIGAICALGAAAALAYWLRPWARIGPAAVAPSIAVLPFADMSAQKDQEYFSDGLAEEILNALTQVEGLHVAGRTSSFSFKGKSEDLRSIGQKLGVSTVLEGSVRKAGNRVRITAQVVEVKNGFHLWSQTFDREVKDIFAVQDEIAAAVVAALRVKLVAGRDPGSADRRTMNPEAYNQYLLGRQLIDRGSPESDRRAVEALRRAVSLDPDYAPAWARLSWAIFFAEIARPESGAVAPQSRQKAFEAAEKALLLAPALADGWIARGSLRMNLMPLDWEGAESDLVRAITLNPGDALGPRLLGFLRSTMGRMGDARAQVTRSVELDPLAAETWWTLGNVELRGGWLESAERAFRRSLEISHENARAARDLGFTLLVQGRPEAGLAACQRSTHELWVLVCTAIMGAPVDAERALQSILDRYLPMAAYQAAQVYAWRGDLDRSFLWLARAFEEKDPGLTYTKNDPLLRKLRGDPRWPALLEKLHLPVD